MDAYSYDNDHVTVTTIKLPVITYYTIILITLHNRYFLQLGVFLFQSVITPTLTRNSRISIPIIIMENIMETIPTGSRYRLYKSISKKTHSNSMTADKSNHTVTNVQAVDFW